MTLMNTSGWCRGPGGPGDRADCGSGGAGRGGHGGQAEKKKNKKGTDKQGDESLYNVKKRKGSRVAVTVATKTTGRTSVLSLPQRSKRND